MAKSVRTYFLTTCCTKFRRTFAAVKWFTTILSLYLIGLSLWPCSDERLPVFGQESVAMVVSSESPQTGSSNAHHDQCTPFCTCACCAATLSVLLRSSYTLSPLINGVTISTDHFTYVPMHWADPHAAIWQPPQIRV